MKEYFLTDAKIPVVLDFHNGDRVGLEGLIGWIGKSRDFLTDRLLEYGAVLFRGIDVGGAAGFGSAAQAISGPLGRYAGGDAQRSPVVGDVYTANSLGSERAITLHNEKGYSVSHPAVLFFYSEIVAESGGETPLLDGHLLLNFLAPDVRSYFEKIDFTYIQNLHSGPTDEDAGKSWWDTYEEKDPERVEAFLRDIGARFWWRPGGILHVEETVPAVRTHPISKIPVLFCQADRWHPSHLNPAMRERLLRERAPDELYHFCRPADGSTVNVAALHALRALKREKASSFAWETDDILVVDNIRALHGRNAFKGQRRVLVAMGGWPQASNPARGH